MNIIEIKQKLFQIVTRAAVSVYPEEASVIDGWTVDQLFSVPDNAAFGFLSTNIVLLLSAVLRKKQKVHPKTIADALVESITNLVREDAQVSSLILTIKVEGVGFINFQATDALFMESASYVIKNTDSWGKNNLNAGKKVLVEYTDPNPFKEFHIGHLMSNSIGESIARLFEFSGAVVTRLCYQGDVGMHVAKTLWAWQKSIDSGETQLDAIKERELAEKVVLLGKWYAAGSKVYADGTDQEKEEIKRINKAVFTREDEKINGLYNLGKQWSLDAFERIYKRLGTHFDRYYFESETGPLGEKIVQENLGETFIKSEGAVIFPGERYGLHSRVFINSQGLPTYEAKELGLAVMKDTDFKYDLSIVVTGNEVNDYFSVLLSAIEKIRPDISKKTTHIGHGMLRLPQGKMSSRTGNVVTGNGLLQLIAERIKEIGESEAPELADTLAISAVKFSLLRQNIGKDVIFDINESISIHGATGVYLQYTHARIASLLKKGNFSQKTAATTAIEVLDHLKVLYREIFTFPHILSQACDKQSPNIVAGYLLNLCQMYNSYYSENRILESDQEKTGLVASFLVKTTLAAGLAALGIQPVDKI